jgi:hypothetical protein
MTLERQIKENKRLALCINLYYKLNLNIYGYAGAHTLYDASEKIARCSL